MGVRMPSIGPDRWRINDHRIAFGAIRSSSSFTVNSTESPSFPTSFFTSCFCSGVRSMRTISCSFFMVSPLGLEGGRWSRELGSQRDTRCDPLFELMGRQLYGLGFLTRLLLDELLLFGGQLDPDD